MTTPIEVHTWEQKANGTPANGFEPRTAVNATERVAYLTILKNSIYSIDQFAFQLEALSKSFEGDVWVVGTQAEERRVGRFNVHVLKGQDSKIGLFWQLYSRILERAREVDAKERGPKVFVTYDPFRNGLLATLLKMQLGWPTIVEVNGSYARTENFRDMNFINRVTKPLVFRAIGGLTIGNADGVRLLYHGQLAGLASTPTRGVLRHYFDNVFFERFTPRPEEPLLLQVGHPFYRKGVDVLLAAFDQVRDEFPEWRLVLVGHQLREHVDSVPPRVDFLPGLSNVEVADWMSRCGCYVLASRSEAMGRVLIEAAACGKARIASRVDGTYTVLEDEVDGLMFQSEDVQDLARQLRRVMGNADLRKRLGSAARTRALVDFSSERYLRHVTEMVRSVLASAASHSR